MVSAAQVMAKSVIISIMIVMVKMIHATSVVRLSVVLMVNVRSLVLTVNVLVGRSALTVGALPLA